MQIFSWYATVGRSPNKVYESTQLRYERDILYWLMSIIAWNGNLKKIVFIAQCTIIIEHRHLSIRMKFIVDVYAVFTACDFDTFSHHSL